MKTIKQLLSSLIHKSFRAGVLVNLNNSQGETDLDAALEDRDEILERTVEVFDEPRPPVCIQCGRKLQQIGVGKYQCVHCE